MNKPLISYHYLYELQMVKGKNRGDMTCLELQWQRPSSLNYSYHLITT